MIERSVRTGRAAGVVLTGAIAALLLCVIAYAFGLPGGGTAAGIAALVLAGVAMAWLSEDGRRLRDGQRLFFDALERRTPPRHDIP
jgi:hypothetical protein